MSVIIDDICNQLGISKGTWNMYIRDGVISKVPKGQYDLGNVASQIIRYQRTNYRTIVGEKTQALNKLKKAEISLARLKDGESGSGFPEKKLTRKEALDLEISKQKLIRMKHENKVRAKSVMPIDNVFHFVTDIASEFAASLDPIVGQLKQLIPDMNAKTNDAVMMLFAQSRNNLARHIEGKTTSELVDLFNPDNEELEELDE